MGGRSTGNSIDINQLIDVLKTSIVEEINVDLGAEGIFDERYVDANALPVAVQPGTQTLILNVDNLTADLDVTNYKPTGLLKNATVRIKKYDDSEHIIFFDKGEKKYRHTNKKLEWVPMIWNGTEMTI